MMKKKAAGRRSQFAVIGRRLLLLSALALSFVLPCVASTIELPDAGVFVNYDFVPEGPDFLVTTALDEDVLNTRGGFLGGKSLKVTYDPEFGHVDNALIHLSVYLTFTGHGVRHALDATFTHSMSLLGGMVQLYVRQEI